MKKFLVILMVVAMASVLFVGCTTPPTPEPEPEPTPTPEPEPEPEPTPTPTVQTDIPYITGVVGISILSSLTQYLDADEGPLLAVSGVGVSGAIIKLYIDDVYAGVGSTDSGGAFASITVTALTLAEGAGKTLHVTATLPGLAESDASTAYTFTYDKTAPTIASVLGDSTNGYITVTFSEAVASATGPTWKYLSTTTYGSTTTPAYLPATTTAPSSTTVRLTEVAAITLPDQDLVVGDYLYVLATGGSTADLAGNLMVIPAVKQGSVITGS